MKTFSELEGSCSLLFNESGPYWHLWTPENYPVIFPDKETFKAAMSILAICARLVPECIIITFQLMTNHLHLTSAGPKMAIVLLFRRFIKYLSKYLRSKGLTIDLSFPDINPRQLETLQDLRNVITYNNRNGYVVSPDETPFTYPWGANAYYFNYAAKARYLETSQTLKKIDRRFLIHSHDADKLASPIATIDGCACPMDFCDIGLGEGMFRCASHYFREVSRNIESQKNIAKEIGESVYYTDDELFGVVRSLCQEKYGGQKTTLLPVSAKQELAMLLHKEYNAGNKQIQRMLKLDASIVSAMFPARY
jgi:REP element-mobilizing transposase RayT